MTSWVSRLLPRNGRSLATASENQRAEDRHRHQEAYGYFLPIQTRWQDNDQYGHVNNVVYYSYFDTIINQYLISPSDPSGCFVMIIDAVALNFSSPDDVPPKSELLRIGTAVS
ncbi:hypothetical protein G4228_000287 [Cervus hanglu yarkandensis]|nr:hypothetical protein G4228_000287 [Cervus hanglu yarkandensis]